MNVHLIEISRAVAPGAHAILILDKVGWHTTAKLNLPPNITLLPLPPRCPELNPTENIWQYRRDITVFRIHSLIVTLGTGTVLHGFTLWMSDSMTISGIAPSLMNAVIVDRLFGIPLEFYHAIGLAALVWYLLDYTALGRRILFGGRGREVARLSGIDTDDLLYEEGRTSPKMMNVGMHMRLLGHPSRASGLALPRLRERQAKRVGVQAPRSGAALARHAPGGDAGMIRLTLEPIASCCRRVPSAARAWS